MNTMKNFFLTLSASLLFWAQMAGQERIAAGNDYISVYQKYIGGIRGGECPMHPSCSVYGAETLSNVSFTSGALAITDRLMRCGHDHKNYGVAFVEKGVKLVDLPPLSSEGEDVYYKRMRPGFAYGDFLPDDSLTAFVKYLINEQRHSEALLEIERIAFFEKGLNRELFINKLLCLNKLDKYEESLFTFETECPSHFRNDPDVILMVTDAHYNLGNYGMVKELTSQAHSGKPDPFLNFKFVNYEGLAFAKTGEWQQAKEAFRKSEKTEGFSESAAAQMKISEEQINLTRKKPIIAGVLSSVLPGAGYAYTGHAQTGISALIINSMLAFATYTSIRNENYGMAALTGVFNLSFYLGNISGSAKSAKRFNSQKDRDAVNRLESISHL